MFHDCCVNITTRKVFSPSEMFLELVHIYRSVFHDLWSPLQRMLDTVVEFGPKLSVTHRVDRHDLNRLYSWTICVANCITTGLFLVF
jgi:hypothetical protein